jgi:hypothetical protein
MARFRHLHAAGSLDWQPHDYNPGTYRADTETGHWLSVFPTGDGSGEHMYGIFDSRTPEWKGSRVPKVVGKGSGYATTDDAMKAATDHYYSLRRPEGESSDSGVNYDLNQIMREQGF